MGLVGHTGRILSSAPENRPAIPLYDNNDNDNDTSILRVWITGCPPGRNGHLLCEHLRPVIAQPGSPGSDHGRRAGRGTWRGRPGSAERIENRFRPATSV